MKHELSTKEEQRYEMVAKLIMIFLNPLFMMIAWNWLAPQFDIRSLGYWQVFSMLFIIRGMQKN